MFEGRFFSFEGIDGSGKSTQAYKLAETLRAMGYEVVLTREPGGSAGAEEIRNLVLKGESDRWSPHSEILLFTAARRDHLEKVIAPALGRGAVVITDRFADSTRLYQGLARNGGTELRALVDQLHDLMIGVEPDRTFLIDIDAEAAYARAMERASEDETASAEMRFEEMGLEMQQRMRMGFLTLAARASHRFVVVEGDRSVDAVAAEVLAMALESFEGGA